MRDPLELMDELLERGGDDYVAGKSSLGRERSALAIALGLRAVVTELVALNENLEQIIRRMPGRSGS